MEIQILLQPEGDFKGLSKVNMGSYFYPFVYF